jgi:hypothetical protein
MMATQKSDAIEIRQRMYAGGYTIWNVWRGGMIIARLDTSDAADEYVANRWHKVVSKDHLRAAQVALSKGRDTYVRFLNVKVAEIEAKERPH